MQIYTKFSTGLKQCHMCMRNVQIHTVTPNTLLFYS